MPSSSLSRRAAMRVAPASVAAAAAGNRCDILGTCALIALLAAAFDQWLANMDIATANERARALRATELVRRDAEKISANLVDRTSDAARALHGVHMQHTIGRVHDGGDVRDWLDHAGFVVGEHDRNKRTFGPSKGASKSIKIDNSVAGDRQFFDGVRSKTAAAAHRGMFDRRDEQLVP